MPTLIDRRLRIMTNDSNGATPPATLRRGLVALAITSALAQAGAAHAFDLSPGNTEWSVRWDNTVRYNIGVRTEDQDNKILGSPNYDDGDRNFDQGSIVTNRLDVLSEFDVVYKRMTGFRVSAAGWYDHAYGNLDNKLDATANTLRKGLPVAGELSNYTNRYAKGVSGEILDAFVFANFDAGEVPISIKAGSTRVLGRQPAARWRVRHPTRRCPRHLEGLLDARQRVKNSSALGPR
jgi:hypothetical protein